MRKGLVLRIAVSLFFITLLYLFFRKDLGDITRILKASRPLFVLAGLLLQLLVISMISARLKLIFNAQGVPLSYKEVAKLSFLGIFFNNFLPTAAGGDIPKAFFAYQKTKKKLEAFACVLGDRFIGIFSLVTMAFLGMFLLWAELEAVVKVAVSCLFLLGCFLVLFLFSHRTAKSVRFLFVPFDRVGWERRIEELYLFLHALSRNKRLFWKTLSLSVVSHVFAVTSVFTLILGLSVSESLIRLFVILPLVFALSMLPSLNGLGIREGAFVYFLGKTIGNESALALSILFLALLGVQSVIGGFCYLFTDWRHVPLRQLKEMETMVYEEKTP